MVTKEDQEKRDEEDGAAARLIVLDQLKRSPRGISITGLVEECKISRMRIRIAIAYLLGSGKILEDKAGMTKLYFLTE